MGDCYITRRGGGGSGGLNKLPEFTYTGSYELIDDGKEGSVQNWRIKFLTSGELTFTKLSQKKIEVFCVGGGGGGQGSGHGGGAGGGYTNTNNSIGVTENTPYTITIGAGSSSWGTRGGTTSAFGVSAGGGYGPSDNNGADGGSGGGDWEFGDGGSDGGTGGPNNKGGTGQGTTTREFATAVTKAYIVGSNAFASDWLSLSSGGAALVPETGVIYSVMNSGTYWYRDFIWSGSTYVETDVARVYAGGGTAGGKAGAGGGGGGDIGNGKTNTGGGGGKTGGSGIVVIRNARWQK